MILVYVDGLSEPRNPGIASYGYVIYKDNEKVYVEYGGLGEQTNNYAEYMALIKALEKLLELGFKDEKIIVKTDSLLIANQINGRYRVRAYNLVPLFNKAMTLISRFKDIRIDWVPREENEEADQLSRKGYIEYIKSNPELLKKYRRYMTTPRQKKLLESLGLSSELYMSRREAYKVISKKIRRRKRHR